MTLPLSRPDSNGLFSSYLRAGNAFGEAISYTKAAPIPVRVASGRARRGYYSLRKPLLVPEKIEKVEKEEAWLWGNKDSSVKKKKRC